MRSMRRSAMRFDRNPRRGSVTKYVSVAALLAVALPLSTTLGWGAPAEPPHAIAIVVNPDVPVDNLSFADLKKVMLGDRQFWTSDKRVTLLVQSPPAPARAILLSKVYEMSEAQFRQYWIAKVFRAETPSSPKIVLSNEMAIDLVAALPGTIAAVDAGAVPPNVKTLTIDGRKPTDPNYPLK
jgi:ABC-type phosphate transport system substrate-binding protein